MSRRQIQIALIAPACVAASIGLLLKPIQAGMPASYVYSSYLIGIVALCVGIASEPAKEEGISRWSMVCGLLVGVQVYLYLLAFQLTHRRVDGAFLLPALFLLGFPFFASIWNLSLLLRKKEPNQPPATAPSGRGSS